MCIYMYICIYISFVWNYSSREDVLSKLDQYISPDPSSFLTDAMLSDLVIVIVTVTVTVTVTIMIITIIMRIPSVFPLSL